MTEGALPLLAITMGDPAGVGPEIIVKAVAEAEVQRICRPLVVADAGVMRAAVEIVGVPLDVVTVSSPEEARFSADRLVVLDLANVQLGALRRGEIDPASGRAAIEVIWRAAEL